MRHKSVGLIQVYTGGGKGKTTAALGLIVRAVGAGKRVCFVQFDKGGAHYSERCVLVEQFGDAVDFHPTGLDRIDPANGRFRFGVTPEDRAEAERGLALALAALGGGYDLVVLDEINTSVSLGLLAADAPEKILAAKHADTELVVTGRDCPPALLDAADLVTEVREVRHYFRKGVPARAGFDY